MLQTHQKVNILYLNAVLALRSFSEAVDHSRLELLTSAMPWQRSTS